MKTVVKTTNRRKFLLAAGLGGAGVAAAVVVKSGQPDAPAPVAAAGQPSGYRASEHILKYYKTTEV